MESTQISSQLQLKKRPRSRYWASQTALIVYILSLIDLLLTLYEQYRFGEIEKNPFGIFLLSSPLLATVYKVVFVGFCIYVLHKLVRHKLAKIAIYVSFLVFALLFTYHFITIGYSHFILFIYR